DDGNPGADGLGEYATPLQPRRHGRRQRSRDRLPLALVVDEEKRAIGRDGAAQDSAELMPAVLRFRPARGREEVACVQRLVPEELERVAVRHVSTALHRQVDDAAVEAAEFRRRAVALDLEFLNGVEDGNEGDLAWLGLEHRD